MPTYDMDVISCYIRSAPLVRPKPCPVEAGFSHVRGIIVLTESTPQLRVVHALAEARKVRHHPDCRCGVFKSFCNQADALWQNRMNRELEAL